MNSNKTTKAWANMGKTTATAGFLAILLVTGLTPGASGINAPSPDQGGLNAMLDDLGAASCTACFAGCAYSCKADGVVICGWDATCDPGLGQDKCSCRCYLCPR